MNVIVQERTVCKKDLGEQKKNNPESFYLVKMEELSLWYLLHFIDFKFDFKMFSQH